MESDSRESLAIEFSDGKKMINAERIGNGYVGWIESNPPSLEAFVKEEHIEDFEKKMCWFHGELVDLNTILYLAEQIVEFPFELFRPNHHISHVFFATVMHSFHQTSILIISRLVTDRGRNIYTLFHFKNILFREWLTEEGKKVLNERLRKIDEGKIQEMARKKTRDLRDFRYAHTLDKSFEEIKNIYHPGLQDLKQITESINSFFDALAFHKYFAKLPVDYHVDLNWAAQKKYKTDIEEILDGIAQRSSLLNSPETSKGMWELQKPLLTEKIEKFNHYRRKFNLPEV